MASNEPDLWNLAAAGGEGDGRPRFPAWRRALAGLRTLKARLTLAAIGCLVVGIGSISMLSLAQVERGLLAQTKSRELVEAARTAGELAQRVVALQQALRLTAERIDPAVERNEDALERQLLAQPALLQQFSTLFLAAPDGRVRVVIDDAGSRRPGLSIADRAYFRLTVAERRPVISDPVPSRIGGDPVVVFSHPIVRQGRVTAVLGGAIRLNSRGLAASLIDHEAGVDSGELLALSDDSGRVIAHPSRDMLLGELALEPRFREALEDWRRQGSPVEPAGLLLHQPGEIVSAAGVAGTGWVVWRALPESVLLAPLHTARVQALQHAAVVIAVLAVLTLLLVRQLLEPLRRLEERARRLFDASQGIHEGWPADRGEIGSLAQALRHVGAERAQLEQFTGELVGKLGSVMAAAPLGIAFTRDQRFELVSRTWCHLLQREESELLGTRAAEAFASEDDYARVGPQVARAFAAGERYEGEWRFRRRDGSLFWGQLCGQPVEMGNPVAGTIWTLADVTASRASREDLEWSATHDPLTGLANRKAFLQRLGAAAGHAPAALLAIDLDRFKPINDNHGHAAGDAMLKAVAAAITAQVRAGDLAARLGGDEFAILLERCPPEAAQRVATDLLRAITRASVSWDGQELSVGASIGVAPWGDPLDGVEDWLAAADAACYAAKAAGRGTVRTAAGPAPKVVELRLVGAGERAAAG